MTHAVDVTYVPVCGECGEDVYLTDDEVWVHYDEDAP